METLPRRNGDFYRPNLKVATPTQMNEGVTYHSTTKIHTLTTIGEMGRKLCHKKENVQFINAIDNIF